MYLKGIVFTSVTLALLQISLAFQFGYYKSISIKNRGDETYLTALAEKLSCQKRGKVITHSSENENTNTYSKSKEWKVYQDEDEEHGSRSFILGAFDNEVTYANKSFRDPVLAAYNFIEHSRHFQIKRIDEGKCLTGNGHGEEISWEKCNCAKRSRHYKQQMWYIPSDDDNE